MPPLVRQMTSEDELSANKVILVGPKSCGASVGEPSPQPRLLLGWPLTLLEMSPLVWCPRPTSLKSSPPVWHPRPTSLKSSCRCGINGRPCWSRHRRCGVLGRPCWSHHRRCGGLGRPCWSRHHQCGVLGRQCWGRHRRCGTLGHRPSVWHPWRNMGNAMYCRVVSPCPRTSRLLS